MAADDRVGEFRDSEESRQQPRTAGIVMAHDWSHLARTSVGFDSLFQILESTHQGSQDTFPPYNLEKLDDACFKITMALAGFLPEEIELVHEGNVLTLIGSKTETKRRYLYQGIPARSFTKQFAVEEHVEVTSAQLSRGFLQIDLQYKRPHAVPTRRIAIEGRGERNGRRLLTAVKAGP